MRTKKCQKCNREITICNFERHIKICNGLLPKQKTDISNLDISNFQKINEKEFICLKCQKKCKSPRTHFWRMHTEEGRLAQLKCNIGYLNGTRQIWNKGQTKETNESLKRASETVKRGLKEGTIIPNWLGKRHTTETKEKISKARKKFLEENPDKTPYLLNHSSKVSYPEKYFIECFSDVNDVIFQHPVFRYKVDFANVKEKRYLEIDGDQHYVDKRIVKHDKERTAELEKLGWLGFRIRWSEFKKKTEEERKQCVFETKIKMKWC